MLVVGEGNIPNIPEKSGIGIKMEKPSMKPVRGHQALVNTTVIRSSPHGKSKGCHDRLLCVRLGGHCSVTGHGHGADHGAVVHSGEWGNGDVRA